MVETWEPGVPAPIIWPRGDKWGRQATPLAVTPDFALWEYRQRDGLAWADLTGRWPQPPWRTRLDRLYYRLRDEAKAYLDARDQPRA